MADKVHEGDKVSWNWGGSKPAGTATEVKAGEVSVTSHRGNEISKTGDESNPAVHISRSGNDVVKKASELTVDKPAGGSTEKSKSPASPKKDEEKVAEKEKKEGETEQKEEEKKEEGNEHKVSEKKETEKEESKAGDKRKAGEKANNGVASGKKDEAKEGEKDAKKQKTETNGTASKKGPGRPKGSGKSTKEKKVPAVGQAQRKTRSQGTS